MTSQEDAKNMALLFFMDHLMQKSGTRTIHDLSCQFGARGFTPEMREAVGTTQEGLQEFLAQYPSLFKVDGDNVSINAYGDLAMGGSHASPLLQHISVKDRDYAAEAVDFFELKLKKFGPELQIKSLLGHRSQAAPEVRLVSGRHVKDFSDFLQQHSHHFIVEGDRVRLANMPEPSVPEADLDESGLPLTGAKAKQTAVEYLRDVLEAQEGVPLPMDNLYQKFCDRFSHSVRQEVATNPKELLQFLKLNRTLFFIRSNKVSLVKNRAEDGMNPDSAGDTPPPSEASSDNGIMDDNYMERVLVVKALKPAQLAIQDIVSAGLQQAERPVVAVDFKIVSLGPQGQEFLTLVCVGCAGGSLYIFDVAHSNSILLESGLKDLLESSEWLKVIHDCKRVSAILYEQYGVHLHEVFDTQTANVVVQNQKTGKPFHEIRAISFFHLQRLYYPESLMQSDVNPRKIHKPESGYWSQRPLSEEMTRVAVEEVRLMVPHIFNTLHSAIWEEKRGLFKQMCDEQVNFNIQKQEVKQIRQERRDKYTMDVISTKLTTDPTGFSLSNREKKLLDHIDRETRSLDPQPTVQNGSINGDSSGSSAVYQNVCSCMCHNNNNHRGNDWEEAIAEKVPGVKMVDSSAQTLSTGPITMTQIYYEAT